jgi:hypothetical protein
MHPLLKTLIVVSFAALTAVPAVAQEPPAPPLGDAVYAPEVGQAGKDVVWVPTPPVLVEKMLDMAKVTPQDFVMDLGSGDGRNIIAAAKRGAQALGVEYNEDMVKLSQRTAEKEGVGGRAQFVQGDMYQADISKANVLALFLLTTNMNILKPKFLDLAPGSRIVSNTFGMDGWEPDETAEVTENCTTWCKALLWIVPAKVEGSWKLDQGTLALRQSHQLVTGTLSPAGANATPLNGRIRGDQITFTIGSAMYTGRIAGDTIQGKVVADGRESTWTAKRAS